MGGSMADMATVNDVESRAYRGVEIMLLLPVALYALLAVGIIFLGFGDTEAGILGAMAALGIWYLAALAFWIASWAVTPILLYYDTKQINEADVGWDPNPGLYAALGIFFGYLMKLHHIYKRHKYVVDWVGRSWWWYLVALGTIAPTALVAGTMIVPAEVRPTVQFLLIGLAILLAVPFPLAIYRDATYVRLNSPTWQPNPGNYVTLAVFFFMLAPVVFPIVGAYYLFRRHRAIGTV